MLIASEARRPADLVIRGARVIDPASGVDAVLDVSIRNGHIAAVGTEVDAAPGQREVDASGRVVMPAFVDPHVHVRVPGREHVESIASGTAAAARGGYCSIVSMPNTVPVIDSPELLTALHRDAAREAVVPIGFAAAISVGQLGEGLTEMCELADAGAVLFTDDGRPVQSSSLLRRAFQYQQVAGLPLALHCEDPELSAHGVMHEGAVSARMGLQGIPSISESTAVARDLRIAMIEDGRIHIQHLSCAESIDEMAWAKSQGARATCEATPHHLLLTDELAGSCDTNFKMNPPLRSEADRLALIEALRSGVVDMIATDHAPHWHEEKEEPFERAPFGVTGLETAFACLYTGLVQPGVIGIERIVEALSTRPAEFLGIAVPAVTTGAVANLVVVDLDATWVVEAMEFASAATNNAFLGRELQGSVELTVAAGAVAYEAAGGRGLTRGRELAGVAG